MLKQLLYGLVELIARIHNKLLSLNDAYAAGLSDKQLHFLVIGLLGMAMLAVVYPLFKALSKKHILVVAWIYVFTMILVITFAIEIGQGYTGTGSMEFSDIMFGVVGFLVMFLIFAGIRGLVLIIRRAIKDRKT